MSRLVCLALRREMNTISIPAHVPGKLANQRDIEAPVYL